ncbi:MAG: hypothetical protein HY784_10055, partial [Chloroflexi bacterium]|nr:hypothetical protein [Chloroflexota bacterium]
RARGMRLFPTFREGDTVVTDPAEFAEPPAVEQFLVNSLRLRFQPFAGVQVIAEYWAPESHAVAGRFTVSNVGELGRTLRLRLSAVLKPDENPQVMASNKINNVVVLDGHTTNLHPVVFMPGGAALDAAPFASLFRELQLAPGQSEALAWGHGGLRDPSASLGLARDVANRDWEGEIARLELLNAGLPEIHTGDPDWDAAFAFAFKVALQSYLGPTDHLPYPSFVFSRLPDRGYSRRGDGADYNWQWDGQVATEAYVNLPQVVRVAPDLAKGVIRNWLAVQAPDGFIDWKPGLAGQRNKALCIPLLASLSWIVYEHTEDPDFLAEVYPGLLRFVLLWFTRDYDRDRDGVPEWSHTIQSAFDDQPSFVRWRRWAQGADITCAECPDLAAYLYRECRALGVMARLLGHEQDVEGLEERAETLRAAVEAMWNPRTASYHFVDRDRVLVRCFGPQEARPPLQVVVRGRGRRGRHRVETLSGREATWYWGMGTVETSKLYRDVESVEIQGLPDDFAADVLIADYTRQDQTLLLPLWAGIPGPERAAELVRKTILDPRRYWRPHGIPNCSAQDPAYKPDNREGSGGVWMVWNTMIGEGLVESGFRAEAAELVARLMSGVLHSLKTEKAFREAYNSDQLEGLGDRDYLWGVAPVGLFLKTLGVRVISPRKVWVSGRNPFPWPVTVKHKGVTVEKTAETTRVYFPGGGSFETPDDRPQFVEMTE